MSEEINKTIEKIKNHVPSVLAFSRALIASIPLVGGGLDHLLFDKAGEIRLQKLELTVNNIVEFISSLNEGRIIIKWFDSIEALELFKQLFNKVEFEHSDSKVKTLSQTYILFGTAEHVDDPNKYVVLDIISKMTDNQREIFKALNAIPEETKQYSAGDIAYIRLALWKSSLLDYINNTPNICVNMKDKVSIGEELDILTSFNLLSSLDIPSSENSAFRITEMGKLVFTYLKETV